MANNVTEKIVLLDANIIRAEAIKKRSLEVIHEENILTEDLDCYNEFHALIALSNQLEKERKKRNLLPRTPSHMKGSSSSPSKKTKQGKSYSEKKPDQKQSEQR